MYLILVQFLYDKLVPKLMESKYCVALQKTRLDRKPKAAAVQNADICR
jgi:hypothetical protein